MNRLACSNSLKSIRLMMATKSPVTLNSAQHFTKVATKSANKYKMVGLAAGALMTTTLTGKLLAADFKALNEKKTLAELNAMGNKKEAIEAHEEFKKTHRISTEADGKSTHWDQLIFAVKGSIEAKRLKELLVKAKKNQEEELQKAVATNAALDKEAERIFSQREKVIRAQCKRDHDAQVHQESELARERLNQISKKVNQDLENQLRNHKNRQNSTTVGDLVDKFKELRCKTNTIAGLVSATLDKKQEDFDYQDKILEENKRLLELREQCREIERALKIDILLGEDWTDQMCQISGLVQTIEKAFQGQDPLALAVLEGLPEFAVKRGVVSEIGLKDRFLKVEKVAQKLAMLKDEGPHSSSKVASSYVRSLITIPTKHSNPDLTADFVPEHLDNAELLFRASACMENNDIRNAVKFMERLQGVPTTAAAGWLNEAQYFLKVTQAINILKNYCTLKINRSCFKSPVIIINKDKDNNFH